VIRVNVPLGERSYDVLVGFGARMANGCTSGHGVCGIGRLSPRSFAAVGTFMATAFATTFAIRHLGN